MCSGWNKEQTALLIECYQVEDVLYVVKREGYHNKFARLNALERIVNKLRPVKPDVTVNEVKAKINAFRSRFNTEHSKLRDKPSGSGTDDIYKSSFEYLEKMLFLVDHVQARKGTCNISVSKPAVEVHEGDIELFSSQSFLSTDNESWVMEAENSDAAARDYMENVTQDCSISEQSTSNTLESPSLLEHKYAKRRKISVSASDKLLDSAGQDCSISEPSTSNTLESPSSLDLKSAKRRKLSVSASDKFLDSAGQVLEKLSKESTKKKRMECVWTLYC